MKYQSRNSRGIGKWMVIVNEEQRQLHTLRICVINLRELHIHFNYLIHITLLHFPSYFIELSCSYTIIYHFLKVAFVFYIKCILGD